MHTLTVSCISQAIANKMSCLVGSATLLLMLLGSVLPSVAAELLRNNDFALNLQYWRKAPILDNWSPVAASTLDLNPSDDYRGDMLWHPLNVTDPGNELFTFQVDISRVTAAMGSAVSFSVEYVDALGVIQRAPLLLVSNTLVPVGDWLSLKRQWVCPQGVQRLSKFLISRNGPGHLQMKNPSLTHELLNNAPLPMITSVSPSSGPYATLITITGENFGTTRGAVYTNRAGSKSDWYISGATELSIQTWEDTAITAGILQPQAGGELTIVTAQQLENSEAKKFDVTSNYFTIKTLTPLQSAIQGEQLTFNFELTTAPGNPGYPGGIGFMLDDYDYPSAYVISPTSVSPAGGTTVPLSVTVDTSVLPPGHYTRHLQTLEDTSYARFAAFEFDIAPRGQSPKGSTTEFESDGSIESGMGLPKHRINLATLDLVLETCLFRMKTHGPPIRLDLWFLGRANAKDGLFGKGWHMSYESNITHDDRTATLFTTSGKSLVFNATGNLHNASEVNPITFTPPPGNSDSLTCYGTYFEYVKKSTKVRYRYEQTAAISETAYLKLITDRNAQTVTLQTDLTTGQITSITDESGRTFSLSYNGDNHCVTVQAPDGRFYSFSYLANRISSIKDPANYSGTYSYDADGFMTVMSIQGKQTTFTYSNRVGTINDKYVHIATGYDGRHTDYAFKNGEHGVTLVTDGRGNTRQHHHQGSKPTMSIDPTGELRQIGYENERPVSLIDGSGNTHMEYDARNNLTRIVDGLGKDTLLAYDANDNLISRTDALGNTWTYEYDMNHNLSKVIDPLSKYVSFTRDSRGRISTITDQKGNTKRIGYDNYGNPTTYTDALNNISKFTYGDSGMRLARITDANGDYKEISYDALDHVNKVEYRTASSILLAERSHQWNAFGEIEYTNERGDSFTNTRNLYGQITSITSPIGAVTAYEYDTSGNRVKNIDPLQRVSTLEYDVANRLTSTIDPLSQETQRAYNASGQLQELRDPKSNLTFWKYDARGDMIQERDSLGEVVRTERDALRRPSRRFNARGQEIQYTYDTIGRMTKKVHYGLGIQYDYLFDSLGNLTSMTGPDGTTTYGYTSRSEQSVINYPNSAVVQFSYDTVGNLESITYPDGLVVRYQYDRFNRISMPAMLRNTSGEFMGFAEPPKKPTNVAWTGGNVDLTYDAASMPVIISRHSGVDTDLTYDPAGRCIHISHATNNTTIDDMTQQYNLAGELVSQSHSNPVSYPSALEGTGSFNFLNQITTWSGNAYTYDKDGNLTSAGGRFTAEYDAESRLATLNRNGNTVTFGYNGLGQRVSRSGDNVRNYLYDKTGRLLCITDSAGNVVSNIIYAGTAIVAFSSNSEGFLYPLFDITGNVVSLTDSAGELLTAYRYLPFGKVQATGNSVENPFTYSGVFGVLDEGNGLYTMRKRFYDATVSKFLQRDPIGTAGGVNLYTYSDNSPLIKNDPEGESPTVVAAVTAAIWIGSRIYNAYGTYKHGANAVSKGRQTVKNARRAANSYNRMKKQTKRLSKLNNQTGKGLDAMIDRQYNLQGARQDIYNSGVKVKDDVSDTATSAVQTVYHGARFIQGIGGATAPEPEGVGGKVGEILTDGSFNEVDRAEIDWENVPDLTD